MPDIVIGDSQADGQPGQARDFRGPDGSPCARVPARRSPSEPRPSLASGGEAERRPEGGPARWEPEGPSPDPSVGFNPRSVTPGIENQSDPEMASQIPPAGMSSRPDWIRLVGLESQVSWLMDRLRADYGECAPHSGAKFFRAGALWHPGILVSWGHKSEIAMIDLQGSRLACTPVEEFMQLNFELLKRGFRCTRIDLAVDQVDLGIDLHKHALASCKAGELCKLRTYSDDSEFKADGTPLRYLLKLGKRTSPICARIYDKGLETKTLPAGQWERFEVEFKDDRANEVCMALADARDKLHELLWGYVIGAVEFRIVNGRSELSRRPFVKWWEKYIGHTTPIPCPPCSKLSSFDTWWEWARSSFGARFLQFSEILDVSPESLLNALIDGLKPSRTESPATVDLRSRSASTPDNGARSRFQDYS